MTSTAPRVNPAVLRQAGTAADTGSRLLAGVLLAQPCRFLGFRTLAARQSHLPGRKRWYYNKLTLGTCSPPYGGHVRTGGLPPRPRGWDALGHGKKRGSPR